MAPVIVAPSSLSTNALRRPIKRKGRRRPFVLHAALRERGLPSPVQRRVNKYVLEIHGYPCFTEVTLSTERILVKQYYARCDKIPVRKLLESPSSNQTQSVILWRNQVNWRLAYWRV